MFSTLFTLALLAIPAIADFSMVTPSLTTCDSVSLKWDATKAPYNVIIVDAAAPCDDALVDLGDHDTNHIHWNVTLPAGSKVQLSVEDANGDEAWSDIVRFVPINQPSMVLTAFGQITVAKGSSDACVPDSVVKAISSEEAAASSTASSSPTTTGTGSTVVVTPTTTVDTAATTDGAAPSAVGAAANSPLVGNGALSVRQSSPLVLLSAIAAVFVFSL
ncbi:hypothetical protein H0H93_000161 [Arthromyces matolae]|nr:hypothetical protein H0H93_000161 [Arthromyces matolae]